MCDRCNRLEHSIYKIEEALNLVTTSEEELDELTFSTEQAKHSIVTWKAHLLRSVNQDNARVNAVDNLTEESVMLEQDWAMKYLPRKYRESQRDWFAKRSIPWHITVATRRSSAGQLETMTFVHIFQSCSQDSSTVLAIMGDVLEKLKKAIPSLKSVFYRSDNAGCYHCGWNIVGAKVQADQAGLILRRMDFSDPQGGKGACDRKAATIKSHMQLYLNEGHDIETAAQMKVAIESSGGVPGVVVTLASTPEQQPKKTVTWDGVSYLNNFQYESDGLRVWKAFDIGPGKLLPWSKFGKPVAGRLIPIEDQEKESSVYDQFVPFKPKKVTDPAKASSLDGEDDGGNESKDATTAMFSCPEEGCVMSYQRHSSLEQHLQCGKHKRVLEQETLLDRAMLSYAAELEGGGSKISELPDVTYQSKDESPEVQVSPPCMGWALRSSFVRRARFNSSQKEYLLKKFDIGQKSGRKVDPATVAQEMRAAKDCSGKRLFSINEFLTSQQIQSFFSRVAAKRNVDIVTEEEEEEELSARQEEVLSEMRSDVSTQVALHHPVMYDTYNICDLAASGGKLKATFSVSVLRDICLSLGVEVSPITVRRKQPYIDKLLNVVRSCTCSK